MGVGGRFGGAGSILSADLRRLAQILSRRGDPRDRPPSLPRCRILRHSRRIYPATPSDQAGIQKINLQSEIEKNPTRAARQGMRLNSRVCGLAKRLKAAGDWGLGAINVTTYQINCQDVAAMLQGVCPLPRWKDKAL